jgi:MerR family redox-sensitive transcriptional activator SoxR
MARRAGVSVSALHFYERKGLIHSFRTDGNQRRYGRATLRRVAVIRVAQSVGIPLAEIAEALATLPDDRLPGQGDWERLSSGWLEDLNRRIAQLEKLRDGLTDCIGCGCLSIELCPLRNPGDRLAADGTGPRRILVERARRPGGKREPTAP